MKFRKDRRSGMPIESPFVFYPKYVANLLSKHVQMAYWVIKMGKIRMQIKRDPEAKNYMDLSLTPPQENELEELSMYTQTRGGDEAIAKMRHDKAIIDAARQAAE